MRFVTSNNTITLPRGGLAVLNVCIDTSPRRVFGTSYEFLENGPGELAPEDGITKDLLDLGDGWPTFFDIPSDGDTDDGFATSYKLMALSTAREDIGKLVTLRGLDTNNAEILTSGVPGETLPIGYWSGGVEGTLSANNLPTLSTSSYKKLTAVQKVQTTGFVCLYTYTPADHRMFFLSKYHPDETQPGYRRYRITSPDVDEGTNVLCQVKARFEPLGHDNDLLPIQNLDALKMAVMAIREENANNRASAKENWNTALGLLNDQTVDSRENADIQLQVSDVFSLGSAPNIQ
jgi:hypothetical protein